jgi:hypothetical protein
MPFFIQRFIHPSFIPLYIISNTSAFLLHPYFSQMLIGFPRPLYNNNHYNTIPGKIQECALFFIHFIPSGHLRFTAAQHTCAKPLLRSSPFAYVR